MYGSRQGANTARRVTDASAKAAIQGIWTRFEGRQQTVARNTLCGLYDAVQDNRSDLALANLSSDAFRKQYRRPR